MSYLVDHGAFFVSSWLSYLLSLFSSHHIQYLVVLIGLYQEHIIFEISIFPLQTAVSGSSRPWLVNTGTAWMWTPLLAHSRSTSGPASVHACPCSSITAKTSLTKSSLEIRRTTIGLCVSESHSCSEEFWCITWCLRTDIDTLKARQNGHHFPDDIFKCVLLNEKVWFFYQDFTVFKFVPKGQIDNIPALVQIMVWRRPGDKPLSEPILVSLPAHICVTRPQWLTMHVAALCISCLRSIYFFLICTVAIYSTCNRRIDAEFWIRLWACALWTVCR